MRNSVRFVGATAIALSMMGLAAPAFAGGDNHKPNKKPDGVNAAVGGDGGAGGAGGVGDITGSCLITAPVTSTSTASCSAGNGGAGGAGAAATAEIGD